jgi:hypothetical protein
MALNQQEGQRAQMHMRLAAKQHVLLQRWMSEQLSDGLQLQMLPCTCGWDHGLPTISQVKGLAPVCACVLGHRSVCVLASPFGMRGLCIVAPDWCCRMDTVVGSARELDAQRVQSNQHD